MNVDFIAPNRLRFKDADNPPDFNDFEQFENAVDHHMENGSDEGATGENFTVSADHVSHE
ncbi:4-hydroxy-tetrahydrodipicolinate synthase [Sesbania bispinosa]|nr:4-hydroxy-tetrahydrodipicolinate synthase [Sesbania bispinosa]